MKTSPLYSLNWRDAGKGLLIAIGSPVLVALQRYLEAGKVDFSWKALVMIGLGGGATYLIKNFFTPAQIVTPAK